MFLFLYWQPVIDRRSGSSGGARLGPRKEQPFSLPPAYSLGFCGLPCQAHSACRGFTFSSTHAAAQHCSLLDRPVEHYGLYILLSDQVSLMLACRPYHLAILVTLSTSGKYHGVVVNRYVRAIPGVRESDV
jgi:hypothetical protein